MAATRYVEHVVQLDEVTVEPRLSQRITHPS
jgi:hypothetical protein